MRSTESDLDELEAGCHALGVWRRHGHCIIVRPERTRRAGIRSNTMNRFVGLAVVVGGLCLILMGFMIYMGWLSWFGRLPGDIRYEGEHTQVYIPIVSMLLLSLTLSLLFYLLRRFF